MKIVVTGALGHIGSRLVRTLPQEFPATEIVMVDDLSTERYCSLFNLPGGINYRFVHGDILEMDLDSLFEGASVVVHLAAITNAAGSFEIRNQVERVNFEGTARVARSCCHVGCALIFPSTTSVYGTQSGIVDEDAPVSELKPQSPYAESKLRAEEALKDLGRRAGLGFVTCRFGTIFGPSIGMRFHTAVNKFCWQAALGQPLTVWQTAMDQHRPYLHLGDAVAAITALIRDERYDGRVYNVVTTNRSVSDIVDIISQLVPDLRIDYVDSEIMNQLSYHVSNERFRGLGFEFRGDLEKGIGETVEWLRGVRKW